MPPSFGSFDEASGEREPLNCSGHPPSPPQIRHRHYSSSSSPVVVGLPVVALTTTPNTAAVAADHHPPSTTSRGRPPLQPQQQQQQKQTHKDKYNHHKYMQYSPVPTKYPPLPPASPREERGTSFTASSLPPPPQRSYKDKDEANAGIESGRVVTDKEIQYRQQQQRHYPPVPPQHNPSTINRKGVGPAPARNSRIACSDYSSSHPSFASSSPERPLLSPIPPHFPNTNAMSRRGGGPQLDSNGRYWGVDAGYPQPAPGTRPVPGSEDDYAHGQPPSAVVGGMVQVGGGADSATAYSAPGQYARQNGMDSMRPDDLVDNYPQHGQYRTSPSSQTGHRHPHLYPEHQTGQQSGKEYEPRQQQQSGGDTAPAREQLYASGYNPQASNPPDSTSHYHHQHYQETQKQKQAQKQAQDQGYNNNLMTGGYDSGYDNGGYQQPPHSSGGGRHSPYDDQYSQSGLPSPYGHAPNHNPNLNTGSETPTQLKRYADDHDQDSSSSVPPIGFSGAPPGRPMQTYNDPYSQPSPRYGAQPPQPQPSGQSTPSRHQHPRYDQPSSPYGGGAAAASKAPGASGVGYGLGGDDMYSNDPYQRYGPPQQQDNMLLGHVNPNDIADDGDDGLEYSRRPPRSSLLSLGRGNSHDGHSQVGGPNGNGGSAAGVGASRTVGNRLSDMYSSVTNGSSRSVNHSGASRDAPGVMAGAVGIAGSGAASLSGGSHQGANGVGGNPFATNNTSTRDVTGGGDSGGGSGGVGGSGGGGNGGGSFLEQRSDWLQEQHSGRKKWKWMILGAAIIIILGGIACGVVFGVVLKKDDNGSAESSNGGGGGLTAEEDTNANGDLGINSKEIQNLISNPNLHKVFAAMDYTALNTQHPDCDKWPPSQNNITRDMAVLSQLTNTVRLYGTDCNQTQMVIHAIEQLEMQDTMKIWLGVWQDGNTTTNSRQLSQMWDILDDYGPDPFIGVIVANEILFREEMSMFELQTLLQDVRDNITARGWDDFVVATSDLGDNWTEELASISDAIMGNIHPFFAGVDVSEASSWTTLFWEGHIGLYKKPDNKMNIISETGWPTGGGEISSSVAGIEEANQFMEDWLCRAMDEKINYFWFEAFDEPWKIRFNEEGKEWEDKWGLLTVNRDLKEGIKIPDCGGMTIDQVVW